jgi:predicted CXXCH cytochrome family protein
LSCHDGTIALGEILNQGRTRSLPGGLGRMPPGKGLQGTDLSDDHPISFEYSSQLAAQNSELIMPGSFDSRLQLDANGELQCTTCHDAHDSPYDKLLVLPNIRSQLCVECHQKTGWTESSHSLSEAEWNRRPPNPWRENSYSTVGENACENCHMPHSGEGGTRLLKYLEEEDNCATCHNGNVAAKDVMASFDMSSAHPVTDTTAIHDPVEPTVVESRHVECVDCHDPHATKTSTMPGEMPANVRGVGLSGAAVNPATVDWQLCLRCHGDSPNQPSPRTPRQYEQANMRLLIQPDNPSFHPITAPGVNDNVPSLIFPLTEQSVIGCGSCHNSSNAVSAGGTGPEGPHGSEYEPLLVKNYSTLDNTTESSAAYALCYECHSRDSILNDESFPEHRKHIESEETPCNACHDPHGISITQGNSTNNSHLINFDTSIVSPNSNSLLQFIDNGDRAGSCDLMCHGEEHDNFEYQP